MDRAIEPSKELNCYIKLKELQLKYPPVDKISISGGRLVSSDDEYSIFSFEIKPNTQRRIDEIQGECTFEINERDYQCSIVELAKERVLLRIKDLNEKQIKKGKIVVDMSHIIKMEGRGLWQLKNEERYFEKRSLLFGDQRISESTPFECQFENQSLNHEQKEAIAYSVGVRDFYLIWGPPGTGKTTIVPEIVDNYIRLHKNDNPRILVCSWTNKALDAVVEKLFGKFKIIRFGRSTLDEKEFKDVLFEKQLEIREKEIERKYKLSISRLNGEKRKLEEEYRSDEKEMLQKEIDELDLTIKRIQEEIDGMEHSLVEENLKQERDKIKKELSTNREKINDLEVRRVEIDEEINKITLEITGLDKSINSISEEIERSTEELSHTKDIIKIINEFIEFDKAKNEVHKRLMNYQNKLEELEIEKKDLNSDITNIEADLAEINGVISNLSLQKEELDKEVTDKDSIAEIIGYYLDFRKKNKIRANWDMFKFKWQIPLYNLYEEKIQELKLSKKGYRELEALHQEKREELEKRWIELTKIQNDLNDIKRRKSELLNERDIKMWWSKVLIVSV